MHDAKLSSFDGFVQRAIEERRILTDKAEVVTNNGKVSLLVYLQVVSV